MLWNTTSSIRNRIIEIINISIQFTMENPFGNYFIQEIVGNSSESEREFIIAAILVDPIRTCSHKFSSNIVLKLLNCGTKREIAQLTRSIIAPEKLITNAFNLNIKKISLHCFLQMQDDEVEYYLNLLKPYQSLSVYVDAIMSKLNICYK